MSISLAEFELAGGLTSKTKLSPTSSGATEYVIPAGKTGVTFQNQGTVRVVYGSSDVDPENNKGIILFPNQAIAYKSVKRTFSIYFKCFSGESGTLGVNETD